MNKVVMLILSTIVCLLPATPGLSNDIGLGAKLGLSVSSLDVSEDPDNYTSKSNVTFGVYLNIPFSERFSFQPELLYVSKGSNLKNASDDFVVEDPALVLQYLDLALLLHYNLLTEGSLRPYLLAGITPGFYLSGSLESADGSEDLEDGTITAMDLGPTFGAGIELQLIGLNCSFDARYMLGITNINDGKTDTDVKNGSFLLMLGVGI